jgi:uncharacterized membrane protein YfcA
MSGSDIAIIVAAVLAGSLVKSITGMGLPLVAIPIMTLFVPVETAVAVIAIPNAAQNLVLVARHRASRHHTSHLALFCGVGIVGSILGSLTLGAVPDEVTKGALAAVVGAYLVVAIVHPDLEIGERTALTGTAPVGFVAGLFQGGIGISGPVVGTWHHGLRLTQDVFVFSVATVFLLTGTTQVVVLGARGLLDGRVTVGLLLTALVISTVPIGSRLRDRLSVEAFQRVVLAVLAVSCASIVVDLVASA